MGFNSQYRADTDSRNQNAVFQQDIVMSTDWCWRHVIPDEFSEGQSEKFQQSTEQRLELHL